MGLWVEDSGYFATQWRAIVPHDVSFKKAKNTLLMQSLDSEYIKENKFIVYNNHFLHEFLCYLKKDYDTYNDEDMRELELEEYNFLKNKTINFNIVEFNKKIDNDLNICELTLLGNNKLELEKSLDSFKNNIQNNNYHPRLLDPILTNLYLLDLVDSYVKFYDEPKDFLVFRACDYYCEAIDSINDILD